MDEPTTAVVLAGGDIVDPDVIEDLPHDGFNVAADSGLDQALALGLEVDLIVGDMDSVSAEALSVYRDIPIELHPADKDHTDLELALRAAIRMGVERIIIVGGSGGRLDHFLANALLVSSAEFAEVDVEWLTGDARLHVIHGTSRLHCAPGRHISLLAVHGPAQGVRTEGLKWELDDEDLLPGATRGVSNVFAQPVATVTVRRGTLLAIMTGDMSV
ncbi:MAG TPA: thiamine diphosphokinase [Acidimicrobiia bacterium]|nr:thiamine diphosphokinase [Acidimicrobiia bacterium]